jgi:hypothetical protein
MACAARYTDIGCGQMGSMADTRRQERRRLVATAADLSDILRTNDWPLGAKERPFTSLGGGDWTVLSTEEAKADPERAQRIERAQEGERACRDWRGRIHALLVDCWRFVNDYGNPDQRLGFESNMLVALMTSGNALSREIYQTTQCLRDFESLIILLTRIGRVGRRSPPTRRKSRLASDLLKARTALGHSQVEAAEVIGTTQSEYSLYETAQRKPTGANLAACRDYIQKSPKPLSPSQPQRDKAIKSTHNNAQ